jgi:hypothetical protein
MERLSAVGRTRLLALKDNLRHDVASMMHSASASLFCHTVAAQSTRSSAMPRLSLVAIKG